VAENDETGAEDNGEWDRSPIVTAGCQSRGAGNRGPSAWCEGGEHVTEQIRRGLSQVLLKGNRLVATVIVVGPFEAGLESFLEDHAVSVATLSGPITRSDTPFNGSRFN
jgi:hypothetical protein